MATQAEIDASNALSRALRDHRVSDGCYKAHRTVDAVGKCKGN